MTPVNALTPESLPIADALIRGSRIDEDDARVVIDIDYLEDSADKAPRRAALVFEGARSLDLVARALQLAAKPGAATILHWKPSAPGNTFLYLRDGVISIWASSLRVEARP